MYYGGIYGKKNKKRIAESKRRMQIKLGKMDVLKSVKTQERR